MNANNTELEEALKALKLYVPKHLNVFPDGPLTLGHFLSPQDWVQIMRLIQDRDKALAERLLAAGPQYHSELLDETGLTQGFNNATKVWREAITEVLTSPQKGEKL